MDQFAGDPTRQVVGVAFLAVGVVLGLVGFLASRRMDAAARRRWRPRMEALSATLFAACAATIAVLTVRSWSGLVVLLVVVPALGLVFLLNRRTAR